ncbi:hypothetical protein PP178_10660 [Zeaxanthinibacter sp. PT1]|uniref:hypothetical protein n=1 Tax=Zeaxanthinibacter TaxID=561554 RepID=UPI00234A474C|nr:hypothetical protein [Zeaxanthinibacter sp. PT1]MDC6352016.1 hypothetical protein [Zeaxanthinibacter sp. PT1]
MMDELDLLKKDWQKKETELPRLSYEEIYRMTWKRSSSIVKWIFYISLMEFFFWTAINVVFTDAEAWEMIKKMHLYEFTIVMTTLSYIILVFFIYKFYINYRQISFTDSSRELMKAILKVKRTVTQYVWFNIAIFAISLVTSIYGSLRFGPDGAKLVSAANEAGNEALFWLLIIGMMILFVVVFVTLLWLFYKLLYGLLLSRLRKNYKELEEIDV